MNTTNLSRCIAALALVAAAGSSAAKVVIRPVVPEALDVSANQELALRARASGVQIYVCTADGDAAQFGWKLKAPEADLFDAGGRKIGRHYAGPTWEAVDGSKVGATVKARVDAPDGKAIPWLLLAATSNEEAACSGVSRTSSVSTRQAAATRRRKRAMRRTPERRAACRIPRPTIFTRQGLSNALRSLRRSARNGRMLWLPCLARRTRGLPQPCRSCRDSR
jgi:hypothetical protein